MVMTRIMKSFLVSLLMLTAAMASENSYVQDFAKANNLFAPAVYKEIIKNNSDNILVSPFSAEVILALTQSGCRSETAQEMRNGIYLPDDNDKIETAVKEFLPALHENNSYTLYTGNKIYVKDGFSIRDSFKKSAVEVYGADIESIEFARNVEAAEKMNKWVEDKTNNKIRNLIDPKILTADTRLVLINALYFKANWSIQFDDYLTKKTTFYKTTEDVVMVDMMHQYGMVYNYHESTELNAKFLELPYKGGDASMVIVLPNEKGGLSDLEKQIDKVLLPQNLTTEYVNVALPKFHIESTIILKDILTNLGITKAFTSGADLSGIAGGPGDLVIDSVVQKTFVNVTERGTEAAASTFISISAQSAIPTPKNFLADHPFIFYIKAKGFIIFVGRVSHPNY